MRDEDGDGFCEVHVNTIEGFWSLLRSWLRPHRGILQDKVLLDLGFFQFVDNARCRGKALLSALVEALVARTRLLPWKATRATIFCYAIQVHNGGTKRGYAWGVDSPLASDPTRSMVCRP